MVRVWASIGHARVVSRTRSTAQGNKKEKKIARIKLTQQKPSSRNHNLGTLRKKKPTILDNQRITSFESHPDYTDQRMFKISGTTSLN